MHHWQNVSKCLFYIFKRKRICSFICYDFLCLFLCLCLYMILDCVASDWKESVANRYYFDFHWVESDKSQLLLARLEL